MSESEAGPSDAKRAKRVPNWRLKTPLTYAEMEISLLESDDDIEDPTYLSDSNEDYTTGENSDDDEELLEIPEDAEENENTINSIQTSPVAVVSGEPEPVWIHDKSTIKTINFTGEKKLLVNPEGKCLNFLAVVAMSNVLMVSPLSSFRNYFIYR